MLLSMSLLTKVSTKVDQVITYLEEPFPLTRVTRDDHNPAVLRGVMSVSLGISQLRGFTADYAMEVK